VRAAYPDYALPPGTFGWEPSTRTVNGRAAWPAPPTPRPRPTRAARVKRIVLAQWPALYASAAYAAARAWHWLTVALVLVACLLSARVAERSRRHWRAHLARHGAKCKPPVESLRDWLREVRAALPQRAKGMNNATTNDATATAATATATEATTATTAAAEATPAPWLLYEPQQTWIELRVHEVFHRAELISRATARTLWHYVSPLTHDSRGRRTLATNAAAHAALFALLLALVRMIYAG
jgi:hypothetical protein